MSALPKRPISETVTGLPSFTAEYVEIIASLERAHQAFGEMLRAELKKIDMGHLAHAQANMLIHISRDGVELQQVRERANLSLANASYTMRRLQDAGLLTFKQGAPDKRTVAISLTEAGRRARRTIFDMLGRQAMAVQPSGNVPDADLRNASAALMKLARYWDDCVEFKL